MHTKTGLGLATALVSLFVVPAANAALVTLTSSDTLGNSSFNTGLHWSDSTAPSAGNDYEVAISLLRTPPDGNAYTFGGDSLKITGPNGDFGYKGTGGAGTITINNLILNGGVLRAINGSGDTWILDGNMNVVADTQIWAKQGPINLNMVISGSAKITNPGSDGAGRTLHITSSANTYTGSIVNNGRMHLADDGKLNFVIGLPGVNNNVTGTGAENVFDGDFAFDLSGASANLGDSWTIVGTSIKSFGATFTVQGFAEFGDTWRKTIGVNKDYVFDEATGVLSVQVPEPSLIALAAAGGLLALRRRK